MKYYSCCVNVKVSFNIEIFSCIEIFWLRIYRIMQKVISPNTNCWFCGNIIADFGEKRVSNVSDFIMSKCWESSHVTGHCMVDCEGRFTIT